MNVVTPKQIVFRADDAGSSPGANQAVLETATFGVVKNLSVMVPGPHFEEAADLLKDLPDVNFGLHVTLNAEWNTIKWGPVTDRERVRSLLDEYGNFTAFPNILHDRGFVIEEAMREVEAQLASGRAAGLRFDYLDEHMGVGWIGFRPQLEELCRREGLLYHGQIPYLPNAQTQNVEQLLQTIREAPPHPQVVVAHPGGEQDPVMRQFTFGDLAPGQVEAERAQDRRTLTDVRIKEAIENGWLASITYLDAANYLPT